LAIAEPFCQLNSRGREFLDHPFQFTQRTERFAQTRQ
jgi:hypothetical protein